MIRQKKIPYGICEMHFVREIWLRHVKYACGRVGDLFHFTSNKAVGGVRYFTIYEVNYFTFGIAEYFT